MRRLAARRLGGVALVAAGLLLVLGPAAQASFPGSTGDMVWVDDDKMVVGDPLDPEQTPRNLGVGGEPRWSPDGTRIAFAGPYGGDSAAIHTINADGTARTRVTTPPEDPFGDTEDDVSPAWSPDGDKIAYARHRTVDCGQFCGDSQTQLRVKTLRGGDNLLLTIGEGDSNSEYINSIEWSPDGDRIALGLKDGDGPETSRLRVVSESGAGGQTIRSSSSPSYFSWAPDGKRIAFGAWGDRQIDLIDVSGDGVGSLTVTLPGDHEVDLYGGLRYLPDGGRLAAFTCSNSEGDCGVQLLRVPDPRFDFDPEEPAAQALTGGPPSTVAGNNIGDFQPARQPIIFIHGFAGSRIGCQNVTDELWPPTLGAVGDDLLDMRLAGDGASPHPDACPAQATAILDSAFWLKDIYESALDFLEEIAPDDHHIFVWDWRKDPRSQMLALNAMINEALDRPLQQRQGVDQVVLVGHSMGGLVMRAYLGDAARAQKVARAATIGTPYWGSPKAIFPLAAGIESPVFSTLDWILPNAPFQQFAGNLTGAYFLYPSQPYKPWLSVDGLTPAPFNRPALEDYVARLGGNPGLLARALDAHRDELDGFFEPGNGLRIDSYRAFVGTGLFTVGGVRLIPGTGGEADAAAIDWVNGDGTVPAESGAQGPVGTADPLGDDVPISYVCNIEHVPLPGDPAVTAPIADYLRYGAPPLKTQPAGSRGVCPPTGQEMLFNEITLFDGPGGTPDARRVRADAASMNIQEAAEQGLLQLLELPGQPIAVTDDNTPVDVTVPADGARMAVTPLSGEHRGPVAYYGPVTGELRLVTEADGSLAVFDDGIAVPPRTTPQPGDPTTPPPHDSPPPGDLPPPPDSPPPDRGVPAPGASSIPPTGAPPASAADSHPPETSIAKAPKRKVKTKKGKKRAEVRFRFAADEPGSSFECKLDKRDFKACPARLKLTAKAGKHKLRVRAIDAAGNRDPTPAKARWKVVRRR